MAMLAEPRRKQKWTLNPRGKHWSEDSNKFGQKMLEKMGWSSGKGLGANLDGMTEHIRAHYKNDQAGIGFSHDDQDKQWTQHQEGYNELLQKLHSGETTETNAKEELSGKSLELKSKQSRARVHYQKFTRGKDVNKYSTKDLANIFGKKDLSEKLEPIVVEKIEPIEAVEEIAEPIGTSEASHGIVTIKGGSITDYFKNKMSIGRKVVNDDANNDKNNSDSEGERYVGFGFATAQIESKVAADIGSSKEINGTPGKRKIDYVFENAALDLGDSPAELERTPKRFKNEYVFENPGLDLDSVENVEKTDAIVAEITLKTEETLTKKKRKKKSKESCSVVGEGFTNEALKLDTCEGEENPVSGAYEIPRTRLGLANDALDLTDESSGKKRVTFNNTVEYDIGVGTTGSKKKKSKNASKLDKFEVDNEKIKRKKKKGKKSETNVNDSAFVNEAMDVAIMSQEANENAINERKIKRERRKRDRRMSNLETIEEAPEEEKEEPSRVVEVVTLDDSVLSEGLEIVSCETRKQKRKKKRRSTNDESVEENSREIEHIDLVEEIPSTTLNDSSTEKKSRRKLCNDEAKSAGKRIKRNKNYESETVENYEETKVKKKTKRVKEDSKENVDNENIEAIDNTEIAKTTKKDKKSKKDRKKVISEYEATEEKVEEASIEMLTEEKIHDKSTEAEWENEASITHMEMQNGSRSPWDSKAKRSKKIFKALFARTPTVHFAGSNINEIKGYGMDVN